MPLQGPATVVARHRYCVSYRLVVPVYGVSTQHITPFMYDRVEDDRVEGNDCGSNMR
jgi:hypothetical protein